MTCHAGTRLTVAGLHFPVAQQTLALRLGGVTSTSPQPDLRAMRRYGDDKDDVQTFDLSLPYMEQRMLRRPLIRLAGSCAAKL
jgi:hypothetical protein